MVQDAHGVGRKSDVSALRIASWAELIDCCFDALGGELKTECEAWETAADYGNFRMLMGSHAGIQEKLVLLVAFVWKFPRKTSSAFFVRKDVHKPNIIRILILLYMTELPKNPIVRTNVWLHSHSRLGKTIGCILVDRLSGSRGKRQACFDRPVDFRGSSLNVILWGPAGCLCEKNRERNTHCSWDLKMYLWSYHLEVEGDARSRFEHCLVDF